MVVLSPGATDGISDVRWSAQQRFEVAVSSWDGGVRRYDVEGGWDVEYRCATSPVLSCDYCGDEIVAGTVDGSVRVATSDVCLGSHGAGVRRVRYGGETRLVFSGGWDRALKAWDLRRSGAVASTELPGKCFALCVAAGGGKEKVVVGTSDQSLLVFDARDLSRPLSQKTSTLKHQTRCVAPFPDGRGYVVTSVEGRVAVEHFLGSEGATKGGGSNYAFKCHRDSQFIHPVNAVDFHPSYGTFVTGGSDGKCFSWDPDSKRRICQIAGPDDHKEGGAFPTSIAALAFNNDGTRLAIASSYNYEHGEGGGGGPQKAKDDVFIHAPLHHEVMPKNEPKKAPVVATTMNKAADFFSSAP
eukprot:CAMPEP_0118892308 /NCGR_PEP_ID=MMETSP1166-20130328/1955_1 /TAXON_ID=1104430 /ORGANISM="Chrysoreinhardia sp, Strain CCMP3193" /LENGTH=355 /DNA_ID=CAMNT_0006831021 /DNA_START=140 /DNA_END=1207 /DNA_ORIENTATION=+